MLLTNASDTQSSAQSSRVISGNFNSRSHSFPSLNLHFALLALYQMGIQGEMFCWRKWLISYDILSCASCALNIYARRRHGTLGAILEQVVNGAVASRWELTRLWCDHLSLINPQYCLWPLYHRLCWIHMILAHVIVPAMLHGFLPLYCNCYLALYVV